MKLAVGDLDPAHRSAMDSLLLQILIQFSLLHYFPPQNNKTKYFEVYQSLVSASVHSGINTPLGRQPPGRHTPCSDTARADIPQADTPRQTSPRQTPPAQCPVHAGTDMATAADSTYPTGMHSFYFPDCVKYQLHFVDIHSYL